MNLTVGAKVRVDKCDSCPAIIGKIARISELSSEPGFDAAKLNFGRGRPTANRPEFVGVLDISLVKE